MRFGLLRVCCAAGASFAVAWTAPLAGAVSLPERTFRMSAGASDSDGPSSAAVISADGRLVAFASAAGNLQPAPESAGGDVFVRELASGAIALVSAAPDGGAADGPSGNPAIAAGVVVFESHSTNLVPGDVNHRQDVFARRPDGGMELISVGVEGAPANGASRDADVSADGRLVVFTSAASNLVQVDGNGQEDVFLHDRRTRTTRLLSRLPRIPANGRAGKAAISGDGRYVTFRSSASKLVHDDTNRLPDVFLLDRVLGSIERVSVSSTGRQANRAVAKGFDQVSDVSANGRYVVFDSDASNLVRGDTNRDTDVFLRDRLFNRTTRLSVTTTGKQGSNDSFHPRITADGRFVVFASFAENLAPGDGAGEDAFLRDRRARRTSVIGARSRGGPRAGERVRQLLQRPSISDDGRLATFISTAPELVPEDANGAADVFLRLLDPPQARWVAHPAVAGRSRRPLYAVVADDPAATSFVCVLDGRVFTCPRRGRLPRLRPGRHVLKVYAGGPGIRFQAEPLVRKFRVKR